MAHEAFLREAIRLSVENVKQETGGPFGAVIVQEGKVIAAGQNSVTTTNDPTAHAEVVAIRHACAALGRFELHGCTLYTSCEPCPMCLAAAYWARVDAVYFAATQEDAAAAGFDDAFLYREIALPIAERALAIAPTEAMRPEAREAFQLWTATTEKTPY
jgi:guanine deaminase